ncbi:mitotic spindle assembly checkpoint protein MAD2A-like [Hydractinia symbiolongicarpus]|uniref:mitotic spindle assembly checkpoint protein MAD2A-like n=1 Tax=Hydractinia symbiolongicarpus TaxID=13093 RepID=UPI00254C80F4|nr:mitotic spindle assembly checkpoint protein MAD2A-like [Hydractinia symbiolongicarpus]XP_057303463.1 mitotic spindle assembly checkpoint protein MAD2A-like [Hydractinia symbiolongicarpus]
MAQSTAQASKTDAITLKGSAELVCDFFTYGVNSILFQRGVYPMESFSRKTAYGLPTYVTDKPELTEYINSFVSQLKTWLMTKTIQKIVLVITSVVTNEDLERWQFNVECDKTANESTQQTEKPLNEIQKEIQNVIRQIVSSVTFLPLIDELCSFNILAYTDKDSDVPATWEDGREHYISNSEEVKLKNFSTLIHKVDMAVCYKVS